MTNRLSTLMRTLLVVLGVVALIATGCGGSGETSVDTAAAAPASESPSTAAAPEEPTVEPALVASTVTGGQIDFGSLEGQDVVLWFWAPW